MTGIALLCRSRLCEADPSPALRAAPFSKGAPVSGPLYYSKKPHYRMTMNMQPLREGARQRRRMDAEKLLILSEVCCLMSPLRQSR